MATLSHEREPAAAWLREGRAETPSMPIEKSPQLNASLARFADAVGEALEPICGEGASGIAERITTTTTFELFGAYRGYPAATLRSAALEARGAMIFDEAIVGVLLDSIFGVDTASEGAPESAAGAPRDHTDLETQIVVGLAKALAACLTDAFAPVASFDLAVEGVHTVHDVNLLGPREMPAILAEYAIKTRSGAVRLAFVLPQSMATPLAEMFARGPDPDAATVDPQWQRRMEQGVAKAKLTLTAVLDEFQMTLGDVSRLRIGGILPLDNGGDGRVRIECVERGVFLCRLGESNGRYALEIEDIIANNLDLDSSAAA